MNTFIMCGPSLDRKEKHVFAFLLLFQWLMDTGLIYSIPVLILVPLIMRLYRIFCQDLPLVTGHGCQEK